MKAFFARGEHYKMTLPPRINPLLSSFCFRKRKVEKEETSRLPKPPSSFRSTIKHPPHLGTSITQACLLLAKHPSYFTKCSRTQQVPSPPIRLQQTRSRPALEIDLALVSLEGPKAQSIKPASLELCASHWAAYVHNIWLVHLSRTTYPLELPKRRADQSMSRHRKAQGAHMCTACSCCILV